MKKPYDFILPNLAIGSFEARLDPIFEAIVTLITPSELRYISQTFSLITPAPHVLMIPIHDGEMGLYSYLDDIYQFLEEHNDKMRLVHCHAGISRSPSAVTHYLSRKDKIHPIDALREIKKKRTIADPYSGFMSELIKWHMRYQDNPKLPEETPGMRLVTEKELYQ